MLFYGPAFSVESVTGIIAEYLQLCERVLEREMDAKDGSKPIIQLMKKLLRYTRNKATCELEFHFATLWWAMHIAKRSEEMNHHKALRKKE